MSDNITDPRYFSLNPQLIPIASIVEGDRMRTDYGDIDSLAESLRQYGLLSPILLTRNEHGYLLVAGGRRLAAAKKLGWTEIQYVERAEVDEELYRELELVENVDRQAMNWVEMVKTFAAAYQRKALHDHEFNHRLAGRLFGKSQASVSMLMTVAKYLHEPTVVNADTFTAAYKALLGIKKKEAEALFKARADARAASLQRKLTSALPTTPTPSVSAIEGDEEDPASVWAEDDGEVTDEEELENLALIEDTVQATPEFRAAKATAEQRVNCADCTQFMNALPARMFHTIITDFPYGIDVDNLVGKNLDDTRDEHDVEENLKLYGELFAPMYRVLKEHAFAVCFIDVQHFSLLSGLARDAGFKVCNWPLTWVKTTPCHNQAAYDNFTKSTEVALVLKKGNPKLQQPSTVCVWSGGLTSAERKRFPHAFSKPAGLIKWIAKHVCPPSADVLDIFCGTGSLVCALTEAGYNAYGVDLVEKHVLTARENLTDSLFSPGKFKNAQIEL